MAVSCRCLPLFAVLGCGGWRQEIWHDIENVGDSKKKAAKLPAGLSEQSLPPKKDSPSTPQRGDLSITDIGDKPRFILNSKMLLFQIYTLYYISYYILHN
jgi:hypothetical protein